MESELRFVDAPEVTFVDRRRKVWLECNAEPYDFRAVKTSTFGQVAQGTEVVDFVCPRCSKRHQSLLFL